MIIEFHIYEKDAYYGKTLIDAAKYGDEKLLDNLISQGADINIQKNVSLNIWGRKSYMTPLMIISSYSDKLYDFGHKNNKTKIYNSMARKLIKAGADLNRQSQGGMTALMFCSLHRNSYIRNLLIKAGADWLKFNWQGKSFLHWVNRVENKNNLKKLVNKFPDKWQEYKDNYLEAWTKWKADKKFNNELDKYNL